MDFFVKRYKEFCEDFSLDVEVRGCLRVNTLKIEENKIVKRLKKKGVKLKKIPFVKHGYWFDAGFSMGATPEYLFGYYHLQEAASQVPVEVLGVDGTDLVLDMCAAPGSKTSQAAQEMENKGVIVALDVKRKRLEALKNNLERLGVKNSAIYMLDGKEASKLGLKFDKVLLDAPCSGNFCLEKDWFNKRDIEDVEKKGWGQKRLIEAAFDVLKKDGILVYSTCSLEPEENELIIEHAIKLGMKVEETGLKIGDEGVVSVGGKKLSKEIERCRRFWPHRTKTQGFFIAKLRKS